VRQLDQEYRQEHPETVDQHPEDDGRDRDRVIVYQLGPEPRSYTGSRTGNSRPSGTCLGQLTLAPLARVPPVQVLQAPRPHGTLRAAWQRNGAQGEICHYLGVFDAPMTLSS
jgi:hypothetical protein